VLSCEKKEGGFNRVFVIRLDNGRSVIARLPTKLAGPPRSNGWLDDDDSLRSMLSNLKQKWTELGLPGESCYQETQEEAKALETRLDRRQATERLRKFLSRQLGCDNDGWVATDRWEDVLPRYREIYRSFVESVAESDPDEDADDLWPFDQR
jgi:hypothetical protein